MTADKCLSRASVLIASREQVSADLTNKRSEVVVLSLRDGVYFELNGVGARIWQLYQQPRSIQSVLDALLDEYEVAPAKCEADLFSLTENLLKRGLLEFCDEPDR